MQIYPKTLFLGVFFLRLFGFYLFELLFEFGFAMFELCPSATEQNILQTQHTHTVRRLLWLLLLFAGNRFYACGFWTQRCQVEWTFWKFSSCSSLLTVLQIINYSITISFNASRKVYVWYRNIVAKSDSFSRNVIISIDQHYHNPMKVYHKYMIEKYTHQVGIETVGTWNRK